MDNADPRTGKARNGVPGLDDVLAGGLASGQVLSMDLDRAAIETETRPAMGSAIAAVGTTRCHQEPNQNKFAA